jgi:hypothetical protein
MQQLTNEDNNTRLDGYAISGPVLNVPISFFTTLQYRKLRALSAIAVVEFFELAVVLFQAKGKVSENDISALNLITKVDDFVSAGVIERGEFVTVPWILSQCLRIEEKRQLRSIIGKLGGRPKKAKAFPQSKAKACPPGKPKAIPPQDQDQDQDISSLKISSLKIKILNIDELKILLDQLPNEYHPYIPAWLIWAKHKLERGEGYKTTKEFKAQVKIISKMGFKEDFLEFAVLYSIQRGWMGIGLYEEVINAFRQNKG